MAWFRKANVRCRYYSKEHVLAQSCHSITFIELQVNNILKSNDHKTFHNLYLWALDGLFEGDPVFVDVVGFTGDLDGT